MDVFLAQVPRYGQIGDQVGRDGCQLDIFEPSVVSHRNGPMTAVHLFDHFVRPRLLKVVSLYRVGIPLNHCLEAERAQLYARRTFIQCMLLSDLIKLSVLKVGRESTECDRHFQQRDIGGEVDSDVIAGPLDCRWHEATDEQVAQGSRNTDPIDELPKWLWEIRNQLARKRQT